MILAVRKKPVSFTLGIEILSWLDETARSKRLNRSKLVEKALENYRKKEIQRQLGDSFERAKNDPEMKELAEMGFEDFLNMTDDVDPTR